MVGFMMPVLVSKLCQQLNFTDFSQIGSCLVEFTMFGDYVLAGVILSVLFLVLIMRFNFPIQLILPFMVALTYALFLVSGVTIFLGFLVLSLIVGGALMIIGILNITNK